MSDTTLYVSYEVTAFDKRGNEIQRDVIKDTGALTVEDIQRNALMNGFDELRIVPLFVETRDEDGNVEMKIEADDKNQATL